MQTDCENESVHVGDTLLRTDGQKDGIPNAMPWSISAGSPLPISKPVFCRSTAYAAFVPKVQSVTQVPADRRSGLLTWSPFYALGPIAVLVDCTPHADAAGNPKLAWVTVTPIGDSIEVTASTTSAGTPTTFPDSSKASASTATFYIRSVAEIGPVTVRRVAAGKQSDVRLNFKFAGGETEITAAWVTDHYDLKFGPVSSAIQERDTEIRLLPKIKPLPTLSSVLVKNLSNELTMPQAVAADRDGLVILSRSPHGAMDRWQVHRWNFADGGLTELLPPDPILAYAELATNGSRVTSRVGQEKENDTDPLRLTVFDLKHQTRQKIECPSCRVADRVVGIQITDTGDDLFVSGLRTPVLHYDQFCKLIETIASERNDWLKSNGQYLTRIGGVHSGVNVYDTRSRNWSASLQNPFGATNAFGSPDGKLIACGQNYWCLLDSTSGDLATTLQDPEQGYGQGDAVAFSPDGRWLCRAGHGVYLLNVADKSASRLCKVNGIDGRQGTLAVFSADSRTLYLLNGQSLYSVSLNAGRQGK